MSRNGTLLPLPNDDIRIAVLINEWPSSFMFRSGWLRAVEDVLREHYPSASSADLRLTARHHRSPSQTGTTEPRRFPRAA